MLTCCLNRSDCQLRNVITWNSTISSCEKGHLNFRHKKAKLRDGKDGHYGMRSDNIPSMSCVNNFEPPNTISAKTLWLQVGTFCHNFSCWEKKSSPLVMGVSTCAGFQWEFALQLLVNMKQLGFLANSGKSGSLVLIQCQDFMGISKGRMRPCRTWIKFTYESTNAGFWHILAIHSNHHLFLAIFNSFLQNGWNNIHNTALLWPSDL